jgi:S1-C subfamily serine protease
LWLGLSIAFILHAPGVSHADSLPADKLKALKDATVLVRVTLPNSQVISGSGFFALEPGLIVTNAHVLGMLDPDSRRPQKVEIVIRSGEADAKTIAAEVLGADRGTDLGIVRVKGDKLPAPLTIETANELLETEEVYAFGFPFGERLGKNITVAKTSVSSLRKSPQGRLDKIQVNGGIHPGNSGGPVIDSKGRLVGISVSGIKNTQIQFAIPVDHLKQYLYGRVSAIGRDLPYRDGDKILQPVRIETLDPLGKLQKIQIEYFTAPNGPPRNSFDKQPDPLPKDSAIKVYDLKYDTKIGLASCEVELTPLATPELRHF